MNDRQTLIRTCSISKHNQILHKTCSQWSVWSSDLPYLWYWRVLKLINDRAELKIFVMKINDSADQIESVVTIWSEIKLFLQSYSIILQDVLTCWSGRWGRCCRTWSPRRRSTRPRPARRRPPSRPARPSSGWPAPGWPRRSQPTPKQTQARGGRRSPAAECEVAFPAERCSEWVRRENMKFI